MTQVLVIGGGAAGMAAALELARRNISSILVERSPTLGGLSKQLACKGDPRCVRCDACSPHDLRRDVAFEPLITTYTDAEVRRVEHQGDRIRALVRTAHGDEDLMAEAVVVATGALPYDADRDPRLHHYDCADVVSSQELERTLAEKGHIVVPSTRKLPKDMAILQCVGSRDARRGMPYCSKACCKYAFKLGRHLRSLYPEMRLTFFFMDWRPLEDPKTALEEWASQDDRVRIIRARPSEVLMGDRPLLRYAPPGDFVVEEAFDLIMLSVGLVPEPGNVHLAELLGIGIDPYGFLTSDRQNILIAGTCAGPKDIRESVEDGVTAAGLAARLLEGGR
jgi:heterodisulfide reductase subunit A2